MKSEYRIGSRLALGLALLAAATALLPACDDTTGLLDWTDAPDTVSLFSLARPDYMGEVAAYALYQKAALPVEQTGSTFNFDFAVSEREGEFVLLPSGVFAGFSDEAGILPQPGVTFDELRRVPSSGYVTSEPVPAEEGMVYAVRTRRINNCNFYGRIQVLDLGADGVLELRAFRNPRCNDRSLVPTADDD